MDYRELLLKYMRHVDDQEGVPFLNFIPSYSDITEEEEKELKTIYAEIESRRKT